MFIVYVMIQLFTIIVLIDLQVAKLIVEGQSNNFYSIGKSLDFFMWKCSELKCAKFSDVQNKFKLYIGTFLLSTSWIKNV